MRYTSIENVNQNDKLGKNIYANDGRVLLSKGTTLTIGLISRLRGMGVESVYLKDENQEVDPEETFNEETKREVLANLSQSFDYIQSGKDFNPAKIGSSAKKIIDELMNSKDVLLHLEDIRTKGNRLLVHSSHVAIMSILMGIRLGYSPRELQELGIGALLHDVGKTVQGEPNSNGHEEHHAWKGFNLLRQNRELSTLTAHVAFQHHEHLDGSGEPRMLKGKDIHPYAQIVKVANDYDHLVAPNGESPPILPYEACEKILSFTGIWYEHNIVWEFLRSIAIYPNGSNVKLSTGQFGTVAGQNKGLPQRPIIRSFSNNKRFDSYDVEVIDLAYKTTIFIEKMVQE